MTNAKVCVGGACGASAVVLAPRPLPLRVRGAHAEAVGAAGSQVGHLGVDVGAVNVKATTTERLGFEGRSEGIASYAVALIVQGGDSA